MWNVGKPRSTLFLILLLLGLLFFSQSLHVPVQGEANGPVVRIYPAQTENLDINSTFTTNVWVDNASAVEGAQVQITYDPTVLNVTQVVEGPFLPSVGQTIVAQQYAEENFQVDPPTGTVYYSSAILPTSPTALKGASGSGVLLNVTFRVVSEGSAQLHLIPYTGAGVKGTPGTYFIRLKPDYTNLNEIPAALEDGFYGSPISLSADPIVINVGESTTLSGSVSGSAVANGTRVDFEYRKESGIWSDLGTVLTNASGYFSRQWTGNETGLFEFQVAYTVAEKTTNGPVVVVSVEQGGVIAGVIIYAIVGLVVLIVIVAVAVIARIRRRGKGSEEPPSVP